MLDQFSRTQLLLGSDAMQVLSNARVAVFGLGGVGGTAAEALARAGVGALDVIDHDRVSLTNVNRQTVALTSTIGQLKADVMAKRIADINPACHVTAHACFYLPDTADELDLALFDYVIDAVDTVTAKLLLIERAQAADVPLISSMGTANKLDPTALRVGDIYQTSICPLAKIIRKECRKRGVKKLKVVYSTEPALPPSDEAQEAYREQALQTPGASADKFGRAGVPGSVSFVPPAAGLILAGEVVKDLVGIRL
jgi:tRNA A37 threonylcarbamoyladenosine dehydratase